MICSCVVQEQVQAASSPTLQILNPIPLQPTKMTAPTAIQYRFAKRTCQISSAAWLSSRPQEILWKNQPPLDVSFLWPPETHPDSLIVIGKDRRPPFFPGRMVRVQRTPYAKLLFSCIYRPDKIQPLQNMTVENLAVRKHNRWRYSSGLKIYSNCSFNGYRNPIKI